MGLLGCPHLWKAPNKPSDFIVDVRSVDSSGVRRDAEKASSWTLMAADGGHRKAWSRDLDFDGYGVSIVLGAPQ